MSTSASPDAAPRVLIVDDIYDNRALLSRRLQRRGYQTFEAEGGREAIGKIETEAYDLVLLDVMMPEVDGLDVLRHVRGRYSADELPIVMVTGKSFSEDVVLALELGANDYVTKPIDFPVCMARLNQQLDRLRVQRALKQANESLKVANSLLESESAERRRSDAQLRYMTHHDSLTGLANRSMLEERIGRALSRTGPGSACPALHVIALDNFSALHTLLGESEMESLLKQVTMRLRDTIGEHDLPCRTATAEFAVLQSLATPVDASVIAARIVDALCAPIDISGQDAMLQCSVGIALAPQDGGDANTLLHNARLARHAASLESRNGIRFFESAMNAKAQARRALETDLRKALAAQDFQLYYQPLLALKDSSVAGFEALLRWQQPSGAFISPAEFVPLAEELGLIVQLGEWTIQRACHDAVRRPGVSVAVNISAVQLQQHGLLHAVTSALNHSGLPASRLELEITESVLLGDNEFVLKILHQLRTLGVSISLDDFGTGYSSFNYLRMFPFDKIKIDQCFVRELETSSATRAMVRAIIGLARELGVTTTAEGVETRGQLEWLREQGCTQAQGYLISRPMPLGNVDAFMENGGIWKAA